MDTFDTPSDLHESRLQRLARALTKAFHDTNAAQRILFESYLRLDGYLLEQPDDRYLHWEPAMPGWQLCGTYLPPATHDAASRCDGSRCDAPPCDR
ncbi:MAG: hypothetical protein ACRDO8_11030 [Nocardioidaceae bacterium]